MTRKIAKSDRKTIAKAFYDRVVVRQSISAWWISSLRHQDQVRLWSRWSLCSSKCVYNRLRKCKPKESLQVSDVAAVFDLAIMDCQYAVKRLSRLVEHTVIRQGAGMKGWQFVDLSKGCYVYSRQSIVETITLTSSFRLSSEGYTYSC